MMLKNLSKKVSMALICSSLVIANAMPAFASTTDGATAKTLSTVSAEGTATKATSSKVTLNEASAIDKITLMSPSYNIAVGENKEIPFSAVDQNGLVLTKYSDIVVPGVFVFGAYWYENVDGTASLKVGTAIDPSSNTSDGNGFANAGPQLIGVVTPTGRYSSITINIQKK